MDYTYFYNELQPDFSLSKILDLFLITPTYTQEYLLNYFFGIDIVTYLNELVSLGILDEVNDSEIISYSITTDGKTIFEEAKDAMLVMESIKLSIYNEIKNTFVFENGVYSSKQFRRTEVAKVENFVNRCASIFETLTNVTPIFRTQSHPFLRQIVIDDNFVWLYHFNHPNTFRAKHKLMKFDKTLIGL